MSSTTFTLRLDEGQKTLITEYAKAQGISMADLMLTSTLDVIEDAIDLRDWRIARAEYDANPVSYSSKEVMQEFGIV